MESFDDPDSDTVCSICYAEFLDTEDLNRHITQYHLTANKNRFCKFCFRTFSDLDALALHIRNHHLSALQSCRYCSRLYLDGDALSRHTRKHKSSLNPEMQCSQCDLTFNDPNNLEKHEYEEHSECGDGVMLQHCYAALSLVLNMNVRNFFKACHGNLSFNCKACKFSSLDMKKFIHHNKATENCRSFCCDICYNVYRRKYELKNHCLKHIWMSNPNPQDQKLKCKLCNTLCTSADEMKTHLSTHSLTNIMQVQICKYCRRPVVGMEALLKHIDRTHKHDIHLYRYNCIYCNITFKHPKFLFGHFFTRHTNIHPYTCKLCNKTFRIRKKFSLHIKLEHKGIGSVEFDDNFHVYFTDKKSAHKEPVSEKTKKVSEDSPKESVKNENNNTLSDVVEVWKKGSVPSQTGKDLEEAKQANKTDGDHNLLVERKRYKLTKSQIRLTNRKRETLECSSDSDVPLAKIVKSSKKPTPRSRKKKTKFFCPECKVNCYTFQNFNRHLSFHNNKECICIKCKQEFKSVQKLNAHIKSKHSTSQLTETLKKIHELKKKTNDKIYVSEQFMATMTKVHIEPSETQATISRVDDNKMSVKKFLESFTPDTDKISVTSNVTIKEVQDEQKAPLIKMTKFTPERPRLNPQKLRMPERFHAEPYVKQKVSIRLVHQVPDAQLNLKDEMILSDFHSTEDNDMDLEQDRGVPEVGHEVMLEETQPDNVKYFKNTIVIDNVPDHNEIVIAHLAPEAPFYKIVKIQDVLHEKPREEGEEVPEATKDLTLPNGMKLVNVNPLAHLLDKDVFKSKLKPNIQKKDFSQAIINAMARLKTPRKIKKERID